MKIYYAHHLWKYSTKIEEYEIGLINKNFPNSIIINPNGDLGRIKLKTESEIMNICLSIDYDILIFSTVDGIVGHGVYDEVNQALKNHKPVYYLINNSFINVVQIEWDLINQSDRVFAIANKVN